MTASTGQRMRWTEREIEFVKDNPQMPIRDLCDHLGRCKSSLNKLRTKLGIYSDFHTPWSEKDRRIIDENIHLPNKKLAELLGRSISSVSSARYHRGHKMQRVCTICDVGFVSKYSAQKICHKCNPADADRKNSPLRKYDEYKAGAKLRGLDFDITIKEFYSFWKQPCTYCGAVIKTIGLDRVDSSKGYLVSNLVPCCSTCNVMKLDLTKKDWIDHMKKIIKFSGESL